MVYRLSPGPRRSTHLQRRRLDANQQIAGVHTNTQTRVVRTELVALRVGETETRDGADEVVTSTPS